MNRWKENERKKKAIKRLVIYAICLVAICVLTFNPVLMETLKLHSALSEKLIGILVWVLICCYVGLMLPTIPSVYAVEDRPAAGTIEIRDGSEMGLHLILTFIVSIFIGAI